jgi:hypothetical protein
VLFALVLLRHELIEFECCRIGVAQHGHLGRLRTSATVSRIRTVVIEFGMSRVGRIGGASGSVTFGSVRNFERFGGTCS